MTVARTFIYRALGFLRLLQHCMSLCAFALEWEKNILVYTGLEGYRFTLLVIIKLCSPLTCLLCWCRTIMVYGFLWHYHKWISIRRSKTVLRPKTSSLLEILCFFCKNNFKVFEHANKLVIISELLQSYTFTRFHYLIAPRVNFYETRFIFSKLIEFCHNSVFFSH